MDMFIDVHPPQRRSFRIHGSERELGGYLAQISDGFAAKGGVWLVLDDEATVWVPASSTVEFNWDVRQVAPDPGGLPVVAPVSVEVLPD